MENKEYKRIATDCRKEILRLVTDRKAAFVGTAFSAIDVLTVLYHGFLDLNEGNVSSEERNFFLLSKGHGAIALYAVLRSRGLISEEQLNSFCDENSSVGVHLKRGSLPGVESSSGSLGHGLGLACGIALANRIKSIKSRVYVMTGDGELNEGSVWEAVMFAAKQKLSEITMIVDRNCLQSYGHDWDVLNLGDLQTKFSSFGFHALVIDGHDHAEIHDAFLRAQAHVDAPTVIIARTIKGKGVSYMEDKTLWHYKWPDRELYEIGLKELS